MYEFAGSKSAKLVVREYGKLVARTLQSIALPARVSTLINPHTYFAGFAVFYNIYILDGLSLKTISCYCPFKWSGSISKSITFLSIFGVN